MRKNLVTVENVFDKFYSRKENDELVFETHLNFGFAVAAEFFLIHETQVEALNSALLQAAQILRESAP